MDYTKQYNFKNLVGMHAKISKNNGELIEGTIILAGEENSKKLAYVMPDDIANNFDGRTFGSIKVYSDDCTSFVMYNQFENLSRVQALRWATGMVKKKLLKSKVFFYTDLEFEYQHKSPLAEDKGALQFVFSYRVKDKDGFRHKKDVFVCINEKSLVDCSDWGWED